MTLLGKIKRRRHHAGGISTAGNVLHMKSINDLFHSNKQKKNTALLMDADAHAKV